MTGDDDEVAAALARNDRFLREFVEAREFCPYAKRCRESGGLERRVLLGDGPAVDEVLPVLRELSGDPFAHVEIGLLVFPRARGTALEWERFVTALREARAREEKAATFFLVAFHPDSAPDTQDPQRTVSFLRRSPDPTLQLVRVAVLERVRGRDTADTLWTDPAALDFTRPMPRVPPTISDRIARANHETVQREGPAPLRALLDELRRR